MSSNIDKIQKDLDALIEKATHIYLKMVLEYNQINDEDLPEDTDKGLLEKLEKKELVDLYESWYSEAIVVVKTLTPDRINEFVQLYKNNKRKDIDYETYTVSDALINLAMTQGQKTLVGPKSAIPKYRQQMAILAAAKRRFESHLFDIKKLVQADLFDSELGEAEALNINGYYRAAGAVAGVVLEGHLKQVCIDHNLTITKKDPTITYFNDLLKDSNVIDIPIWRNIQYLADIRNKCDHKRMQEPTQEEIKDLINGVNKITKTVV